VITDIPAGTHDETEIIRKGVPLDKIIDAMTRPLTEEEKSPKAKEETPRRIIFKGNLDEINSFFYRRGWSGGLPVVPPTEEKVREMLQGTYLAPDHLVARVPIKHGSATVEKIAINAVMAGALPIHLPLLIAGTKALEEHPEWWHAAATMISTAPCWVVNGPIRNDISINSGRSLFSSGMLSNVVIPRAMYLIIRNIGGVYRPGVDTLSWYGHEAMSSLAFGENEEESPWEPLHVEHGFKREDSTISLFFVSGSCAVLHPKNSFFDDKGCLDTMVDGVKGNLAGSKGMGGANCLFTLSSGAARLLAKYGWEKKKILSYILEETKSAPRNEMVKRYEATWGPAVDGLRIVVAGAVVTHNTAYQHNGGFGGWVTKKAELPAKWNELVKKYNVLPAYDQALK
jgi:hypothetical protein